MIGKKIPANREFAKSKASHIYDLTRYIVAPDKDEKLLQHGALNFISQHLEGQQAEMIGLAISNVKTPNPVTHYLLSWREGEVPSSQQLEEAVAIFLDEMGASYLQVVYGAHQDTQNVHVHIAVNRVDPRAFVTDAGEMKANKTYEQCVKFNGGFDLKAIHRAVARIEHAQKWQPEANALYRVNDQGIVVERGDHERDIQLSSTARDVENRYGERSAERVVIEDAAPVVKSARSWTELHTRLAEIGIGFTPKGSGAIFMVGHQPVKASVVRGGHCSMDNLTDRFGEFQSASSPLPMKERQSQPVIPCPRLAEYLRWRAERRLAERDARDALRATHGQENADAAGHAKTERKTVMETLFGHGRELRNAFEAEMAYSRAVEREQRKQRHKEERVQLRRKYSTIPDFETWLREQEEQELAERWRYRRNIGMLVPDEEIIVSRRPQRPDIRNFDGRWIDGAMRYVRADGGTVGTAAFEDRGDEIAVRDWRDPATLLAALQLASAKYGTVRLIGSDEFIRRTIEVAVRENIEIGNRELQERVAASKTAYQQKLAKRPRQMTGREEKNTVPGPPGPEISNSESVAPEPSRRSSWDMDR